MARREVTGRKPGVTADLIERKSGSPDAEDDQEDDQEDDEQDDEPTKHDQPATVAKRLPIRGPPLPRLAFSIPEFCTAFRISPDFYFKLKRQRQGPREMKVGKRTLISVAAADEWRIERERATAAEMVT